MPSFPERDPAATGRSAMFRLFVGVSLPADVRLRLAAMCSGLPGAKWIDPENMHLTLRFIGEVGGGQAEDIDAALRRVSAPAFDLGFSGIDCFETSGKVHTLWVGIDKQPLLLRLRDKVDSALVRAGCEAERRKFKPHVTIARIRPGGQARIGSFIQAYNSIALGPSRVEHFTLFRSHLGSEKAHYEELAEYALETNTRPSRSA
jgi:RNA 2',3'-cyclic 3'-phosphodiesterase